MSVKKVAAVLVACVVAPGFGWSAPRSRAEKPAVRAAREKVPLPNQGADEATAEVELHMVCLSEGVTETGGKIHGGRAAVTVNRPGKTVVLFLGAYESVTWTVTPTRGTRIGKVFLGGYHEQAIQGLPKGAELLEVYYEKTKGAGGHLMAYYESEPGSYLWETVLGLAERTGLNVSSYQGLRSPKGEIEVNAIGDGLAKAGFHLNPTPVEKLPQLKFQGVTSSGRKAAFGPFTLAGPGETSKPLPDGIVTVAYDPDREALFGLGERAVFEVDLGKGTATEMNLGLDVPRLHRPCGITYDTKLKRLLVLSSPGYLYAYGAEKGEKRKWSALAKIESGGLIGLAHVPDKAGDKLYGLSSRDEQSRRGGAALVAIGTDGKLGKPIKLPSAMFPDGLDRAYREAPVQLIAVEGKLVVVTPAEPGEPSLRQYVIDPTSGTTRLVLGKGVVHERPR